MPVIVEVRTLHKFTIALLDILQSESPETADTEVRASEGANDIAMHHGTFEIIDAVAPIRSWLRTRQVAKEATGKSIARTSRIDNFFQGIGWSAKVGSICAKQQGAIAAQLHYCIVYSQRPKLSHCRHNASLIRVLADLLFAHQENVDLLHNFGQLITGSINPQIHRIEDHQARLLHLLQHLALQLRLYICQEDQRAIEVWGRHNGVEVCKDAQ